MQRLVTIGYEGAAIEALIQTLQAAEVAMLVDIREAPISRRADFGKRALEAALTAAGIAYCHEPRLGAPKSLRDQVKSDRDYTRFFEDYAEHLAANEAVVEELAAESSHCMALMCYERDYRVCHRYLVADALAARTGLSPQHLRPPRGT
jgi:uncharacterized protein (DUF488 family)